MDNSSPDFDSDGSKPKAKTWSPGAGTAAACMIAASVGSGQFSDALQTAVRDADSRNDLVAAHFAPVGNVDARVANLMKGTNTLSALKRGATEVIYQKGIKEGSWNVKILSTIGAPVTLAAAVMGVNAETESFAQRIKQQREFTQKLYR